MPPQQRNMNNNNNNNSSNSDDDEGNEVPANGGTLRRIISNVEISVNQNERPNYNGYEYKVRKSSLIGYVLCCGWTIVLRSIYRGPTGRWFVVRFPLLQAKFSSLHAVSSYSSSSSSPFRTQYDRLGSCFGNAFTTLYAVWDRATECSDRISSGHRIGDPMHHDGYMGTTPNGVRGRSTALYQVVDGIV